MLRMPKPKQYYNISLPRRFVGAAWPDQAESIK